MPADEELGKFSSQVSISQVKTTWLTIFQWKIFTELTSTIDELALEHLLWIGEYRSDALKLEGEHGLLSTGIHLLHLNQLVLHIANGHCQAADLLAQLASNRADKLLEFFLQLFLVDELFD